MPQRTFRFLTECSICGEKLVNDRGIVALLGNRDSTGFQRGFIQKNHKVTVRDDAQLPFPAGAEYDAERQVEAVATHFSCCQVFLRNSPAPSAEALNRLWVWAAWRDPMGPKSLRNTRWPGELDLPPRVNRVGHSTFLLAAGRSGLARVGDLPAELRTIIQGYAQSYPFSSYLAAMDLARRLSALPPEPPAVFPLSQVLSWQRGTTYKLVEASMPVSSLPIVRLSFDWEGLVKVERLAEMPPFDQKRPDNMMFLVRGVDTFQETALTFKNGLARLRIGDEDTIKELWDTPTPPPLDMHWPHSGAFLHTVFRTINLEAITGLTFLLMHGTIFGLHLHSKKTPVPSSVAGSGADAFNLLEQRGIWIYLPLPPGEKVIGFGCEAEDRARAPKVWLFRTRLAGDVVIGRTHGLRKEYMVQEGGPSCLAYGTRSLSMIPDLIPYYDCPVPETRSVVLEDPDYPNVECYSSSATLHNVRRLQLFDGGRSGRGCKGLLVDYESGAQRALGQCRLGVLPSRTYVDPSSLCFRNRVLGGKKAEGQNLDNLLRVEVDNKPEHTHREEGWECYPMTGTLKFYCSHFGDTLKFKPDDE